MPSMPCCTSDSTEYARDISHRLLQPHEHRRTFQPLHRVTPAAALFSRDSHRPSNGYRGGYDDGSPPPVQGLSNALPSLSNASAPFREGRCMLKAAKGNSGDGWPPFPCAAPRATKPTGKPVKNRKHRHKSRLNTGAKSGTKTGRTNNARNASRGKRETCSRKA